MGAAEKRLDKRRNEVRLPSNIKSLGREGSNLSRKAHGTRVSLTGIPALIPSLIHFAPDPPDNGRSAVFRPTVIDTDLWPLRKILSSNENMPSAPASGGSSSPADRC
jgi:hypothetical protein